MGFALRRSPSGGDLKGTVSGQTIIWNNTEQEWDVSSAVFTLTDPVFVENYLIAAGNSIRDAIVLALQSNPNSHIFILPSGRWEFVGDIREADGFRDNIEFIGQKTELFRDVAGVATGQQFFFLRLNEATDRVTFRGIKFSLLNCLTSFFGSAILTTGTTNCRCYDCEFFCTLAVGVTSGRLRWGLAFLGTVDPAIGPSNNIVDNVRTTLSQIQLCAAGRSADGILCTNIESVSNNDYIVSCVSSPGFNCRNVTIDNVVGHDVGGSGCVFAGSDGTGTALGADIVENITISNISVDGTKNPVLLFSIGALVVIDLGHVSQNINLHNVNTTLVSTQLQARSVLIAAQDDGASETGISVSGLELGNITTNDPLEALFISGRNTTNVQISNVNVQGQRGIKIIDCDRLTLSNITTTDGSLTIVASSRNLTGGTTIVGSSLKRTSGFNSCVVFQSAAAKNFDNVAIGDCVLDSNIAGQLTTLGGGTMRMILSNVWNVSGNNPTAETLTGIIRAVNTPGLPVVTTISVTVPAVVAGSVGYVIVSMAGTRMSDIALNEGVVVNPQADLVAAGVGGGFINARVSSAGNVKCAYVGPLAGGAVNHTFARAAA